MTCTSSVNEQIKHSQHKPQNLSHSLSPRTRMRWSHEYLFTSYRFETKVFASYRFGLRSPRTILIDIPKPMLHVILLFQRGSYTVLDKLPRALPTCIGGVPQAHLTCVSLTYVTHPSSVAPSPANRGERGRTCRNCYIGANIKW
jgi:hypothetical protein